jgi:hypothetical protein
MVQLVSAAQYERLRELLVEARENSGLKQWMVAAKMDVLPAWVSRVFQGHKCLDLLEFVVLCKAMQADPKDILAKMLETTEGKELGKHIRSIPNEVLESGLPVEPPPRRHTDPPGLRPLFPLKEGNEGQQAGLP